MDNNDNRNYFLDLFYLISLSILKRQFRLKEMEQDNYFKNRWEYINASGLLQLYVCDTIFNSGSSYLFVPDGM